MTNGTSKFPFHYLLVGVLLVGYIIYQCLGIFIGADNGDAAPPFTAELIDGSEYSLSESEGHYVILDFWGSWCGPCLRDNPLLVTLSNKYAEATFDNNAKLHIVSVALEKKGEAWKRVSDRFGFNWKRQIVHHHAVVLASPIARAYGVTDLPAKFLIGPDGNIITANASFADIDDYLSKRAVMH